jgi:hypothetical protein
MVVGCEGAGGAVRSEERGVQSASTHTARYIAAWAACTCDHLLLAILPSAVTVQRSLLCRIAFRALI